MEPQRTWRPSSYVASEPTLAPESPGEDGWAPHNQLGHIRAEDQPQSPRVRHRDPRGDRAEQIVVVAVAATGLVADLEAVGQRLEDPHHLVDGADLGAADDLPGLAEDADRDTLVVDIEPDVEHGCLLKSKDLGTAATG